MINYLKEKFSGGYFFYSYLKHKIIFGVSLSILVGILDAFGLTMFLPLLQTADGTSSIDSSQLGKLSFLIDFFVNNGFPITIGTVLLIMIIFFIFKGIMAFFQFYYRVNLQEQLLKKLRVEFIQGVTSIDYKYFTGSEGGRIQNTLTTEVERVTRAYQSYFMLIQNLIMVTVYLTFAYFVNTQFAILVTIGGGLTSLIYRKIYSTTKNTSRSITSKLSNLQGLIFQLIQNFKYLKATGRMADYSRTIESTATGIEKDNKRVGLLMAILNSSREPLVIIVVASIIFLQTNVFNSPLAPILVSLLFFYRALSYLMQMQSHSNYFMSVSGSIDNMVDFKKELIDNKEESGNESFNGLKGYLEIRNGSFTIGTKLILSNINLKIKKYETIAIVGESGSGKTSLINIITAINKLDSGQLSIDGVDIDKLERRSYRSKIGYISQDPVIFTDTVFNNVTFWDKPNNDNILRFNKAIETAACSGFIQSLDDKEQTKLGLNGVNLSGGQRQRISIARELYREVEMLLLDEATSSLDSETEKVIQENIESLKGKYTIVIVAHRLSTVKNADRIILLKNGEIVAVGDFEQLISESTIFERMVSLQEFTK